MVFRVVQFSLCLSCGHRRRQPKIVSGITCCSWLETEDRHADRCNSLKKKKNFRCRDILTPLFPNQMALGCYQYGCFLFYLISKSQWWGWSFAHFCIVAECTLSWHSSPCPWWSQVQWSGNVWTAVAVLCCQIHSAKNNTFPLKTSFPSCYVVLEFSSAKVMGDSVVAVKVSHLLWL